MRFFFKEKLLNFKNLTGAAQYMHFKNILHNLLFFKIHCSFEAKIILWFYSPLKSHMYMYPFSPQALCFLKLFVWFFFSCRYGACELHSVAAYMGGAAAQEVIKIITAQFVPINNTYIYNAIKQTSCSTELW
jgi:amyloid beta precursor protein binding protein 1